MKKTSVKILTLVLTAAMLVCMLASCAKKVKSGSYEAELELFGQSAGITYTFKGNKVEAESKISVFGVETSKTVEGTYKIEKDDDGELQITFDFEDETDYFKNVSVPYSEGDGYIKIAGVKYEKK